MGLEVKEIVVGYHKDIWILQGVSLTARDQEITIIIGPNGAGKSTLLKTVYGYLVPAKGTILYNGEDVTGCKPYKLVCKGIAFVPQSRSVFPDLTVRENLELGAWTFRRDRQRVKNEIERVLYNFPVLQDKLRTRAGTLSGGQQRMLELARALLVRPRTLLLDEPSVGLAPGIMKDIYTVIKSLCREHGVTILLVDQNVKAALDVCDYVYVLNMGRNDVEGPRDLFGDGTELVRSWLAGGKGRGTEECQEVTNDRKGSKTNRGA